MQILFCTSEASPFAKTGGLADVAGSLPEALHKLGCDVRIFMPLYRCAREMAPDLLPLGNGRTLRIGPHDYHVHFWQSSTPSGIPVYFLEKDEFFDRAGLYGSPLRGDYEDNAERFIAFSQSVRHLCEAAGWFPSIFHLHDWQTGLVAPYFKTNWRHDPRFARSATVFTIHNIAYQGVFPAGFFPLLNLPPTTWSFQGVEFWGQCNLLKAGIVYSDFVTTVSPRYAAEITTSDFGFGLEGVLKEREKSLRGILNGIDTDIWDPGADSLLPANYTAEDLSGKKTCKLALCRQAGFSESSFHFPMLGMIGRLAAQKGFDLLEKILPDLMKLPVNLAILGSGDASIEQSLQAMEKLFPDRLKLTNRYDEQMAHLIEAGSDIFLMPSRYEPCGLNQMYSLRYGTIPVVFATGGLENSVRDVFLHPDSGTGFKFTRYEPQAFLEKIESALEFFKDLRKWQEIQKRAMARDFSWAMSAKRYLAVYDKVWGKRNP
ncbi:MAG: glycogen synthase GlgA [Syntrophobacteraceae bacterium]|nr:glycogen synthase GlgA [Syntrophobacteraceae bacterium]